MKRTLSVAAILSLLAGTAWAHPGAASDPDDIRDRRFKADVKAVSWDHDDDRIAFTLKSYTRFSPRNFGSACYQINTDQDPEMELGAVIVTFGGESPGFAANVYEGSCGGAFPVNGGDATVKKTGPRSIRLEMGRQALADANGGEAPASVTFFLTVNASGKVDRVPNGKKSLTVEL